MAGFNELITTPKTGIVKSKLTLDPTTILEGPEQFTTDKVKTMTVANGSQIQVYDVTDPSNPVLIATIG